jgi:hypothetical protein
MATITSEQYVDNKYRTKIEQPDQANQLRGAVTVTLKEPPIGQPNFTINTKVVIAVNDENRHGIVTGVIGPAKYKVSIT